jgi:hypothetical protein
MARLVNQIPWYVTQTLERSARLGSAVDVYSHLSDPRQQAQTQARRDQFAREMRQIRHLVQTGVDEDKPVAAPQPRVDDVERRAARSMYPYLGEEAVRERERYARWEDMMRPWGFVRSRAPSDWWAARKGK